MKNKLITILLALLFAGTSLYAVELRLVEEDITETGSYSDDYIFKGETLNFRGNARDLFFLAKRVNFTGKTGFALSGLAEFVMVNGEVSNGIKSAARDIEINGTITGTSLLAAANVIFGKQSIINGDTFIGARKVSIQGPIKGNLNVGAAEVTIQNVVEGNVTVYAGQLLIPEEGKIKGNLIYHSEHPLTPEEAARVTGEITFEKSEKFFDDHEGEAYFEDSIWPGVLFKISFLIIGLLLLLIPINRVMENRYTGRGILSHALWGLIPIFVYPSAFVVSILLVITLPLALVLLLGLIPVVFVSKVLGLTMIGSYLAAKLKLTTNSRFIYFLLAVIPYSLLSFIPVFGILLLIFVTSIGSGWLLSRLFNKDFS